MNISKMLSTILLFTILIEPYTIVNATTIQSNLLFTNNVSFATWLWNSSEIINNSHKILKFLVNNNVKVLYLQIDYNINYSKYKIFISNATKNNIAVEALDGSPDWISSDGTILQNKFFNWLTQYQKIALPNERFKGVHLDVEPYLNSNYNTNKNYVISNYQDFILSTKNISKKLNLNFGIDIPFWFNQVLYNTSHGSGNLAEWIFKNIKTVSIMAYRDIATGDNGIIKIAQTEMNLCRKYNVKVNIAVDTMSNPETTFITFFEEGQFFMYNQLNIVYLNYCSNPSFAGFAIHHLDSWMNIKP